MSSWLAMLQDAAEMFVFLAVELSLLFIVISAGVSLIRQKVPDHKIQQMMGARKGERLSPQAALLGSRYLCSVVADNPNVTWIVVSESRFGPTSLFYLFHHYLIPLSSG